ncbi:hypothetical protein [Legionella brunensis]|uniref:Swiss Army Knife 2H phosphoesterase domain-containing protein n=1 Tax=Legionella brunensis TaxID=29422 RepID=A0A0W0S4G5_9GAMM|nr:hypothetical protein [Legionella brunensis]KTC78412.1 hypothetical protein Lbru_2704 [Legionella brunensis]
MINNLKLIHFNIPELLNKARSLPLSGRLTMSTDGLLYLDLSDDYIHTLYPLLKNYFADIVKPDYFGQKSAGAHISVIYPEENKIINSDELEKQHSFEILQAFAADLVNKRYYVLAVSAPTLVELRNKYGLGPQLNFKSHWIDLHITVGVSSLDQNLTLYL